MNRNKIIFYILWSTLLLVAPVAIVLNTPFSFILKNEITIINTLQRLTGLWVFTMLFVQIFLGAYMTRLTEKFGGWIFRFHIVQGIIAYFLIVLHPSLFILFEYFGGKGIDPLSTFIDVCVLCGNKLEFAYSFGRISFWLLTIGVFAGYFRLINPFLRVHWRKFHILNYLAFVFISLHSSQLGSDVLRPPFVFIYYLGIATVVLVIVNKVYRKFISTKIGN